MVRSVLHWLWRVATTPTEPGPWTMPNVQLPASHILHFIVLLMSSSLPLVPSHLVVSCSPLWRIQGPVFSSRPFTRISCPASCIPFRLFCSRVSSHLSSLLCLEKYITCRPVSRSTLSMSCLVPRFSCPAQSPLSVTRLVLRSRPVPIILPAVLLRVSFLSCRFVSYSRQENPSKFIRPRRIQCIGLYSIHIPK